MECYSCNVEKLPDEFPPEPATTICQHVQHYCMRCVLQTIGEESKCPDPDCRAPVTLDHWHQSHGLILFHDSGASALDDPKPKLFQAILNTMFRNYDTVYTPEAVPSLSVSGTLTITLMTGDSMQVPYDPNMRVTVLKEKIRQQLKHETHKQKLLYNDLEITDYKDSAEARLKDFGIHPNVSLCLVIVLFAIPETFDDVVFDLYWGYPANDQDYLDASCLLYNGQKFVYVCDYSTEDNGLFVRHSGDVMDDDRKIGHHTINVALKRIPLGITHLFFTPSAWNSPNISKYPNPSLKFYQETSPNNDLCRTSFTHANHSQAVIMCSMSRGSNGKWKIFESGKLSAGNAADYSPLQDTIRSLISQGI